MGIVGQTYTSTVAAGASITGPIPAGVAAGDVLVAVVFMGGGVALSGFPAGWTKAGNSQTSNAAGVGFAVHGVTDPAAEPAGYTFSATGGNCNAVLIRRYSGANAASPLHATCLGVSLYGDNASWTGPTTTVAGCMIVSADTISAAQALSVTAPATLAKLLGYVDLQYAGGRRGEVDEGVQPAAGAVTISYHGQWSYHAGYAIALTPAPVATTTTASASPNPAALGASVVLTATVAGTGTPVGSVQFAVDGAPIGAPVALVAGVATLTTSALTAGAHVITAVFTPTDPAAFAPSSAAPYTATVLSSARFSSQPGGDVW